MVLMIIFFFFFLVIFWLVWKKFLPKIEDLLTKKYALFFLVVVAHNDLPDLSLIILRMKYLTQRILETVEFLMASGLFLHCLSRFKFRIKSIRGIS